MRSQNFPWEIRYDPVPLEQRSRKKHSLNGICGRKGVVFFSTWDVYTRSSQLKARCRCSSGKGTSLSVSG